MQVHRPVVLSTVFLAAGIVSARFIPAAFVVSASLCLIFLILSAVSKYRLQKPLPALVFLALACLAGGNLLFCKKEQSFQNRRIDLPQGRMIAVQGRITVPVRGGSGFWTMEIVPLSIDGEPVSHKEIRYRTVLRSRNLYHRLSGFERGHIVSLLVFPQKTEAVTNPGQEDFAWLDRIRGIDGGFYATGMIDDSPAPDPDRAGAFIYRIRKILKEKITGPLPENLKAFVMGVALGTREDLPENIEAALVNTGTMHIMAASGLHASIVAGVFLLLLYFFKIKGSKSYLLTVIPVVLYAMVAGATPSIVRASVMAALMLTALAVRRDYDGLNALGTAAFAMLVVNPYNLFLISFQLSFTAVLGIILYFGPVRSLLPSKESVKNALKSRIGGKNQFRAIKIIEGVFAVISVSIAVTLWLSPIIAYYFNRLSLVNLPANMLIVPLATVILPLAVAGGIISIPIPLIGAFIVKLAAIPAALACWYLNFLGNLPFASVKTSSPESIFFILYYALLILPVVQFPVVVQYKKKLICFVLILSLIAVAFAIYDDNFRRQALFLDSHGQQAVIIREGPRCHLVLSGIPGLNARNTASSNRALVSHMQKKGVHRIDTLIVTMADRGSKPALAGISGNFTIGRIVADNRISKTSLGRMLQRAEKSGLKVDYIKETLNIETPGYRIIVEPSETDGPCRIAFKSSKGNSAGISLFNDKLSDKREEGVLKGTFAPVRQSAPGEDRVRHLFFVSDDYNILMPSRDGALMFNLEKRNPRLIDWRKAF